MDNIFKFLCPFCGQKISATLDRRNTVADCPSCNGNFKVPGWEDQTLDEPGVDEKLAEEPHLPTPPVETDDLDRKFNLLSKKDSLEQLDIIRFSYSENGNFFIITFGTLLSLCFFVGLLICIFGQLRTGLSLVGASLAGFLLIFAPILLWTASRQSRFAKRKVQELLQTSNLTRQECLDYLAEKARNLGEAEAVNLQSFRGVVFNDWNADVPGKQPKAILSFKWANFAAATVALLMGAISILLIQFLFNLEVVPERLITPLNYRESFPNPSYGGSCPIPGCHRNQFYLPPGRYSVGVRARKCDVHADRSAFTGGELIWLEISGFVSIVRYIVCFFLLGPVWGSVIWLKMAFVEQGDSDEAEQTHLEES